MNFLMTFIVSSVFSLAALAAPVQPSLRYSCYPSKKDPDVLKYDLRVAGDKILLGYFPHMMRRGDRIENKNQNWTKDYAQYAGPISQLRGDGYVHVFLQPELLTGGAPLKNGARGGRMIFRWGRHTYTDTSYLCVNKDR